ncbi:MAG: hypothetical protein AB7O65_11875 [Candidatus Korobacteraceae bacterium]
MMPFQQLLRRSLGLLAILTVVALLPAAAPAQEGQLDPAQPTGISTDEIIRRFASREKEFKEARERYTYRQDAKIQEMEGNTPMGEWHQVVDILFDNRGRRIESVVFAPQPSLRRIMMTKEDVDDLQNRLPFVLTTDEIPEYQILYVGQQKQDELNTYVFDVAPKQIQKGRRYFQGRIWVDDRDLQIVKTRGKSVPEIRDKKGENLFPEFTTYREQIDGRYWFPTYTRVDDTLNFSTGDVRIRQIVRYTNYKRFGADVKITYGDQEVERAPGETQKPGEQPSQPQQKSQ